MKLKPVYEHIKPADELASIIDNAKKNGQKVVATNGVFDFLHVGHVKYLEESRSLGDMLVIALNSDASVKRIKGPERPINNQDDRAYLLAALESVDYVTFFEEDTASDILDKLKPNVYTKGGDYDPETIPEAPLIKKNGGEVRILGFTQGYSNSDQFEKIRSTSCNKQHRATHLPE